MLAHVHLAKALEEGEDGQVQLLPGTLRVALLVEARVHDGQQPKHAGAQVAVYQLLLHAGTKFSTSRLEADLELELFLLARAESQQQGVVVIP